MSTPKHNQVQKEDLENFAPHSLAPIDETHAANPDSFAAEIMNSGVEKIGASRHRSESERPAGAAKRPRANSNSSSAKPTPSVDRV